MKISYIRHIKEDKYVLAMDEVSGKYCISIPVFNGMAGYNEYYEISNKEYDEFSKDLIKAKTFVDNCQKRKEDSRLMQKPGKMRGSPV